MQQFNILLKRLETIEMKHYKHLSTEERAVIQVSLMQGSSLRDIGRALGRSASTISREVSRQGPGSYQATLAAERYKQSRCHSGRRLKLQPGHRLTLKVRQWLIKKQWSPMQISGSLKRHYPDDIDMQVSHETIYRYVHAHPRGSLKKLMKTALRQGGKARGFRGNGDRFNSLKIAPDQFMAARPEEINDRLMPGHWEGDLIIGAMNQSCVGTLVERQTGYVVLSKMKSKSALDVRKGFERQMKKLPDFLRQSMTYDRGAEMSQHPLMSANLDIHIYFADPHAPWQRGSSENTNGLLRQYLPKGTDLSGYTQRQLNNIAMKLNTRPRQRFNFYTPQELMDDILEKHLN